MPILTPGGRSATIAHRFQLQGQGPAAYERYLVPAVFAPCAAQLLDLAGVRPGERVLDVACGTGIVARQAALRVGAGGAVTGTDLNQGMVEAAEAAAAGLGVRIEWRRAEATALPLPDGAVDLVCCQQGLQFFPDRALALAEARRVLAPGGRVALAVWRAIDHNPGYAALAGAIERHAGAETAAIMHAPFSGPDRQGLGRLLAGAGFAGARVRIGIVPVRFGSARELLEAQAVSSPLGPPLAALDEQAREALAADVDRALAAWSDDDGLLFPAETWLATAHRDDHEDQPPAKWALETGAPG
jgi:SAM-dependent methyltransferase